MICARIRTNEAVVDLQPSWGSQISVKSTSHTQCSITTKYPCWQEICGKQYKNNSHIFLFCVFFPCHNIIGRFKCQNMTFSIMLSKIITFIDGEWRWIYSCFPLPSLASSVTPDWRNNHFGDSSVPRPKLRLLDRSVGGLKYFYRGFWLTVLSAAVISRTTNRFWVA